MRKRPVVISTSTMQSPITASVSRAIEMREANSPNDFPYKSTQETPLINVLQPIPEYITSNPTETSCSSKEREKKSHTRSRILPPPMQASIADATSVKINFSFRGISKKGSVHFLIPNSSTSFSSENSSTPLFPDFKRAPKRLSAFFQCHHFSIPL